MKYNLIFISLLFLSSCSFGDFTTVTRLPYNLKNYIDNSYKFNDIQQVELGSPIINRETGIKNLEQVLKSNKELDTIGFQIKKGLTYKIIGLIKNNYLLIDLNNDNYLKTYLCLKDTNTIIGEFVFYKNSLLDPEIYKIDKSYTGTNLEGYFKYYLDPIIIDNMFKEVTNETKMSDTRKSWELIYIGKSNNTMKLSYKEYLGDLIRPAYSQEIQYDLNESKIIGFKGLRIEVINANNFSIEFKVLSD